MQKENNTCCYLSWIFFARLILILILLGIPFNIYNSDKISIFQMISAFGAIIGFYLFYQRNKIFENQLLQKDNQYLNDSQFKNFLEATKMLTDKDATNEAKISALYLLYDVAKSHPDNLDRIIQVINKQLVPLMKCVNNKDSCSQNKYSKVQISEEIKNYPFFNSNKKLYEYQSNHTIDIDDIYKANYTRKTITQWQYEGNDTEKVIATALYILKQIIIDIAQKQNEHIELSNTIIFDLDTDFTDKLKFQSKKRPASNLIFLNCKLEKVNFTKTKFVNCQFIHSQLTESDFSNANLWGSSFINCDLKDVKFDETECEGVEFRDCKNLIFLQIKKMQNKDRKLLQKLKKLKWSISIEKLTIKDFFYQWVEFCKDLDKQYLFISKDIENNFTKEDKKEKKIYFKTSDEYREWKNEQNAKN